MKFHTLGFCLLAILWAQNAPRQQPNQQWTSPDGVISVTPPDAEKFQQLPEPPPTFLVLWISSDESIRLGVMKSAVPPHVQLIQSVVQDGLAEEMKGTVSRLPTAIIAGREIWKMRGKNDAMEITQAIVRHEKAVYKVMAVNTAPNSAAPEIDRFFESIAIEGQAASTKAAVSLPNVDTTKTSPKTVPPPPVEPAPTSPATALGVEKPPMFDLHNLSKRIGSISVIVLVVGAVLYFLFRQGGRETPPVR
jgi:hypothetical protein